MDFVDTLDEYSLVEYAIPLRQVCGKAEVGQDTPEAGAAAGSIGRKPIGDGEGWVSRDLADQGENYFISLHASQFIPPSLFQLSSLLLRRSHNHLELIHN